MTIAQIVYELVGPREGATILLGGRKFIDGLHTHVVANALLALEEIKLVSRAMSFHSAYPSGSPAFDHAQAAWEASQTGAEPPPPFVPGPDPIADKGKEPTAEVFKNQKLIDAIMSLDPENPNHWVGSGLPLIGSVEKIFGQGGLNRRIVSEALPDWNRSSARDAAVAAAAAPAADPAETTSTDAKGTV